MEEIKQMCETCGAEMVMMDEVMACPTCSAKEETAEVADESTESTDEAAA